MQGCFSINHPPPFVVRKRNVPTCVAVSPGPAEDASLTDACRVHQPQGLRVSLFLIREVLLYIFGFADSFVQTYVSVTTTPLVPEG